MAESFNRALRQMMKSGAGLIIPGASNALTARVIETVGYKTMFVTGAGVTNTYLGLPDIGVLSLKELVDHVWAIRDVVSVPLMVDADTGFGNAVNVSRAVKLLERAGASSIMIEDQVFPKRCGHFEGKSVISAAEMVQKVKAAVDARVDSDLIILARTDARAVEGMAGAIDRINRYREAGADVLFVEAPRSVDELAQIPAQAPGVHICNMVIGGKTPLLHREKLAGMGYGGIVYANAALQASLFGMSRVLSKLREEGSIEGVEGEITSFQDRQKYVNHQHYQDLDNRYSG